MTPTLVEFIVTVPDTRRNEALLRIMKVTDYFRACLNRIDGFEGVTVRQVEPEKEGRDAISKS